MTDKKLNIFFAIFLLLFGLTLLYAFFGDNIRTFTRASQSTVSLEKSLMIASQLQANTNATGITISVFARNSQGISLSGKEVALSSTLGTLDQATAVTDNYGQAKFVLKSTLAGEANLTAQIGQLPLPQTLKVKFVNQ